MKTLLSLIILAIAASEPVAAEVLQLSWDKNPEPEPITYQVVYGRTKEAMTETLPPTDKLVIQTPELASGTWIFGVVAIGETGARSEMSDTVTYEVKLSPPTKLRVVEIQTSSNLKEWKTIALVPQSPDQSPTEFVRARISAVTPEN